MWNWRTSTALSIFGSIVTSDNEADEDVKSRIANFNTKKTSVELNINIHKNQATNLYQQSEVSSPTRLRDLENDKIHIKLSR